MLFLLCVLILIISILRTDHESIFFDLSHNADPLRSKRTLCSHIIKLSTADQFLVHFSCDFSTDLNYVEFLTQLLYAVFLLH